VLTVCASRKQDCSREQGATSQQCRHPTVLHSMQASQSLFGWRMMQITGDLCLFLERRRIVPVSQNPDQEVYHEIWSWRR
jgi:hypothetical protein